MNKAFPLQMWLATVLAAPIVTVLIVLMQTGDLMLDLAVLCLSFGIVYSIPLLLIVYGIFLGISGLHMSIAAVRWITLTAAIAGIWITCLWISGFLSTTLAFSYSITVLLSSFFFRVKVRKEKS